MRFAILFALLLVGTFQIYAFDPAQQDDSRALVRHFSKPSSPVGPAIEPGAFVPIEGETISLMGGADVFRMQESGDFEAMLQAAFPDKQLHVRNLAWSADTVYRQQRPMFFYTEKGDDREGSVPDQREKVAPGTMILMFGKMESLDGEAGLSGFESAYEGLVVQLQSLSKRIVLVAPVPFVEAGPAAKLAAERNAILKQYTGRIASLADRLNLIFVSIEALPALDFVSNGMQLSEEGQSQFAIRLARGLGIDSGKAMSGELVAAVRRKNDLWHQYYRPTNWAFLFGDRQHVPSSRDHKDTQRRWFEEEMKKLPPMMADQEKEIWALAKGGQR
ncbi:MAG: hypothetical protein P1U87_22350 [Verrucomicrobiales bacterium]|nr:hypothetical protein [Verrucomicrobiales bacterium]